MMIKANGEYLDFDGDIEIESQIKLFEEIETANGDYSYSFDVSKTINNLKILGFPFPDTVKSIYNNVPCEIIDDAGFVIYTGSLQVNNITDVISCTFFSGNTEWFGLLTEPMTSLPLYKYDVTNTVDNIVNSWTKTSGIVFPIIDTGTLIERGFSSLQIEDFTGCFYVKTLFNEIFGAQGITLSGDLLNDDIYNQLLVCSNTKSQDEVNDRSCYAGKTSTQSMINGVEVQILFDNLTGNYFAGGNFSVSTYTADVNMVVKLELSFNVKYNTGAGIGSFFYVNVKKNGTDILNYDRAGAEGTQEVYGITKEFLKLEAGDYLQVYILQTSINIVDIQIGSTIKITPQYVYKTFGKSTVPKWTQGEFVSNVLRIFNVIPSYKPESRQLTLNLFNKIKEKEPIDVSDEVTVIQTDFSEFVSNYGKNNNFTYQESDDEDLREYNIANFVKYGAGRLTIDNDFIENEADVLESDFTSPTTYINPVFDMSMERINFIQSEEIDDKTITSVSDSSGTARFNMSNADDLFSEGDLVAIETDVVGYNSTWVVTTVTTTYIVVFGLGYISSATGTATLLRQKFTTNDDVYLFVNVANVSNLFFSSNSEFRITNLELTFENQIVRSCSIAYFNLLANGRQINTKYKQSLSFGEVNSPLSYQKTLLDTYWPIFSQILADPVKLLVRGYFNRNKFTALKSFLRPLRIKTNETNNLYYLNRITGYKSGHEECEAELIKL